MTDREMAPDYETGGVAPEPTRDENAREIIDRAKHLVRYLQDNNSHIASQLARQWLRDADAYLARPAAAAPDAGEWHVEEINGAYYACHHINGEPVRRFPLRQDMARMLCVYLNALASPSDGPAAGDRDEGLREAVLAAAGDCQVRFQDIFLYQENRFMAVTSCIQHDELLVSGKVRVTDEYRDRILAGETRPSWCIACRVRAALNERLTELHNQQAASLAPQEGAQG